MLWLIRLHVNKNLDLTKFQFPLQPLNFHDHLFDHANYFIAVQWFFIRFVFDIVEKKCSKCFITACMCTFSHYINKQKKRLVGLCNLLTSIVRCRLWWQMRKCKKKHAIFPWEEPHKKRISFGPATTTKKMAFKLNGFLCACVERLAFTGNKW